MRLFRTSILPAFALVACSLLCAAPAFAQQAPVAPSRPDYGFVSFSAGATFGTDTRTSAAFGGEYGEDIISGVQAYVNISYFENLMRQDLTDELVELSSSLSANTGTPWDLSGRDLGVTLVGGGRYLFNSRGTIQPYLGGGAGIINVNRTIEDPRAGDVTAAVLNEFGVGEVTLTTRNVTRPLVEGALGVAFFSGPVYVDVGYRYKRAFHLDQPLDFSQAVVGVGYRF